MLLTCLSGAAQDVPRVETYSGYSYVRFNSAGRVPPFSSNGGTGQLVYNFNPWLSFVGDFGGYYNGVISGVHVDNTVVNYQFGPSPPSVPDRPSAPRTRWLNTGA